MDGTAETVKRHLQQHARERGYVALLRELRAWLDEEIARAAGDGDGGEYSTAGEGPSMFDAQESPE